MSDASRDPWAWRFVRQRSVPEIGLRGQRRLLRSLFLPSAFPSDPLALRTARDYLERAGARLREGPETACSESERDEALVPLPLPTSEQVRAWVGDGAASKETIAAMLAGALGATAAVARCVGLPGTEPDWRTLPCPLRSEEAEE